MQKTHLIKVALAGNPNAGKTSIFNALTGAHHKVGNYPGVTVEKREGYAEYKGVRFHIIDLPGIYSLTAYSLDEVVTRDFVLQEKPDVIIDVLDSSNLERNLYLLLQFIELGIPVAAALNMADEAEAKGIRIDADMLSRTLGVPMVSTVASRGLGIEALLDAVLAVCSGSFTPRYPTYGSDIETRIATLQNLINQDAAFARNYPDRWMAVKLLEKDPDARKRLAGHSQLPAIEAALAEAWHWIDLHYRKAPEIIISEQRYGYIHGAVAEAVRRQPAKSIQLTEQIDSIVMHPLVGLPMFLFVIWGIFRLTFVLGAYPVALLESFFSALEEVLRNGIPEGIIRDALIQGLIHGVGGVFSFVPLIVILFFCISLLEDTGYIARAAFLTDRFLHTIGLHGQSFMPLMLGFGCSVPAIMATRTLKSPRDRIATILAIPFISCGAKMPVYVLLAGAFFPQNPSGVVLAMYAGGVLLSIVSTFLLRRTVLKGEAMPFVMELPPYRLPTLKGVLWHVWEKTWNYTKKAGTVILAVSIAMWLFTSFPIPPDSGTPRLEYSLAGRFGRLIEPVLKPIGFDWKTSVALVPGLAAKELVVSTLGVLYGAAENDAAAQSSQTGQPDRQIPSLREALRQDPHWSPRIALALMVFVLVMPPCFASLATIRAEAGSRWMLFQIGYSLSLAWLLSFAVSMLGKLVGLG